MWYEDLTECNNFGDLFPANHIAVGWLENGKSYTKGKIPEEIVNKIYELYNTSEIRHRFCGYHKCDFCDYVNVELGATTIWVTYKEVIYNCPALIIHYIEKHNYRPPGEFIEAVLEYNHQDAMKYLKKLAEKKYPSLRKKK